MNARVIALMSNQAGLVTRGQAIEAGMSADQVDRLTRSKRWTVVRKGVYAESSYVQSLRSRRGQRMLADRATSLRIQSPHVLSHHSAAYLLDLDVLHERPEPLTHVTRPGIVGSHQRRGVKHHRAPYDPAHVVELGGVRLLGPARTACDIARDQGFLPGLVAADSALRGGATVADLKEVASGMVSWPYKTTVDDVVASASAASDSVNESLGRALVTSLGFGVPTLQFGLTADGRTVWCDLRLNRHLFECDGRVKYQRIDEGGLASRSAEEVVWFEKQRQDFVCGFKLGMSRIVWEDAYAIITGGPLLERVQARLTREYLDTCQRFGTDISDLAPYRPLGPRPRPERRRRAVGEL